MSRSRRSLRMALLVVLMMSVLSVVAVHAQEPTTLNIYAIGVDTNISDWLSNTVTPAFEAANPQYKLNIVIANGGITLDDVVARITAAKQTGSDPQVDVIEGLDPSGFTKASVDAGIWTTFSKDNIPNYDTLNPAINTIPYGLPYRGSQVLLAYDSTKIPEDQVPKTFDDLIKWVQANPGQFVYCRPDKGGSGMNFVIDAIYAANGGDPSKFTTDNYSDDLANQLLPPAWKILSSINSDIYENGSYPAGNLPSLQLLANGSVSMITAWSDQSLQALQNGTLPDTVKLTQFTDLPMPGGYVYTAIPVNAAHMDGALAFANYYISLENEESVVKDIGGFPTINESLLPQDLQTLLSAALSSKAPPVWPSGQWSDAVNAGWYKY
ncbi:MAG TPA: extracellular solute-binding protein, partial [Tepidisphaeraceae bacterium]|nr:extracellular solute-binding protein [Tepidisphaeraceae bacterium]